ncbi:unnamed protein product [Cylindrotheca closterium]|uniref:Uncharacterized protein n=1 Tax=Cylindrotheca closterium TaxID=2856 RepID=A0AAD2G7W8_9STRA|nr:unnamed protein product [Cylindrotheca closterium]
MFRSSKKKGRKHVIRTSRKDGDSSDEDDIPAPALVITRHKKRKAKGMVVRSFDEDHGESISVNSSAAIKELKSKKRKKRKGTGMGFGGGAVAAAAAVAQEEQQAQMEQEEQLPKPLYDKDALQKLKAEQKVKPVEVIAQNSQPTEDFTEDSNANVEESDFIAMQRSTKEEEEEDVPFPNTGSDLPSYLATEEDPEESTEWQNQVAKRAGFSSFDRENTQASKIPSLEALKNQLKSTLENLENQQEDLGNAIMRRQADLQQTEADCKRHEETLKETGKACDYYQALRNDIAVWVGALRDLQAKVKPVFQALLQLVLSSFANAEEEWKKCPEDVFSVLHQINAIDRSLGHQIPIPPLDAMAVTVDEFGRDVKSQYLNNRDKRYKARLEQTTLESDCQVGVEGSLDYLWSEDSNPGGRKERYEYLQQALRVATEDLNQDYTSLQKLIAVFDDWKQSYPEEYRQCYAVLSLGDLAAALVQADFCKTAELFSLHTMSSESKNDDSVGLLKVLEGVDDGIGLEQGDSGAIQRVLEQNHVVLILEVLKESPSACFISSTRSKALCKTLKVCLERIDKDTKTYSSLQEAVFLGIQGALECISITLLKSDFDAGRSARGVAKEQVEHAVQFSCREQANWIQHILVNMLEHWLVALRTTSIYDAMMERILQFISGSYLLLLSSMDKEVAATVFAPIWIALHKNHSIFMDSPAYMIQSAPVRAAAMAYGFNL